MRTSQLLDASIDDGIDDVGLCVCDCAFTILLRVWQQGKQRNPNNSRLKVA